jgi:RNA polymerase sigma-70 factor, ECF subfamily
MVSAMSLEVPAALLAAIERNRRRVWTICYRMTGEVADADELSQEAIARAIERRDQLVEADPTGWLIRIATTTCLDHLRRSEVRRVTELVDPVDLAGMSPGEPTGDPERAAILREDVRYAVVVALQNLTPRQRAALILHDVCDRPVADVALALDTNANAAKALVHRARVALAEARYRDDVDVPVDVDVVEKLARAIEAGELDTIADLLAEDAWGVVDGGGVVQAATRPSFGRRSVSRRFANAWGRLGRVPLATEVRALNAEPAVIVRLGGAPAIIVAVIHVETRAGQIAALRIDRDPRRTQRFALPSARLGPPAS